MTPRHDLISIELSGDSEDESSELYVLHENGKTFASEQEFQQEINRLKQQSSKRFRDRWENILTKYTDIDDEKESDEIDLVTGKVIVDNGHLKSLKSFGRDTNGGFINHNVWSLEYDAERDMRQERRHENQQKLRKNRLKEELRARKNFHNQNPSKTSSPNKSPNRKVSPDNILLLDPSPTKKQKPSPLKVKTDQNHFKGLDKSLGLPNVSESENTTDDESVLDGFGDDDSHNILIKRSNPFLEPVNSNNHSHKVSADNENSDSDEEFLIVSSPYLNIKTNDNTIYLCVFGSCYYTTGNKDIFKRHLLDKHRPELYIIGYPLSKNDLPDTKFPKVTHSMVNAITEMFPIMHEVPPLPLSGDGEMFCCGLPIKQNKKCTHEYVSRNELSLHQRNHPFDCSVKIQVYICPLLGCGFMSDDGYFSWRQHFIDAKHHIKPSPRDIIHEDEKEQKLTFPQLHSKPDDNITPTTPPKYELDKEINDFFDDTSEISYDISTDFKKPREVSYIETPKISLDPIPTNNILKDLESNNQSFDEFLDQVSR